MNIDTKTSKRHDPSKVEVSGTYPYDSRRWRKLRELTLEEAAKLTSLPITAEQLELDLKYQAGIITFPRVYLWLNKGYVVLDKSAPKRRFMEPENYPPGTQAVYLHDGKYSLIEWI